jgi:hypothetical protein
MDQVIPNARRCKALLDRITDRARIPETGTESYRFRRAFGRQKKGANHGVARQSVSVRWNGPVAGSGMRVKLAANVLDCDEIGQSSTLCPFNLVVGVAQLWRDERKVEPRIERPLGRQQSRFTDTLPRPYDVG